VIRAALLVPAGLAAARAAEATDYASPAEVLDAIDRLEADAAARLHAIGAGLPAARGFTDSALADQVRQRGERASIRRRLGVATATTAAAVPSDDRDLERLRVAQEALVHAHAEGLPALHDAAAVDLLARHMVVLARHLAVIQLWIEAEDARG
jgi:hypothetical protein